MTVVSVNSSHFGIIGKSRKSLGINIPGICLVFFKSRQCPTCIQFEPEFIRLSASDRRIQTFAICDITEDRRIPEQSLQTQSPITSFPTLLLYVNKEPVARIEGRRNIANISSCLNEIFNRLNLGQSQQQPHISQYTPNIQQPPVQKNSSVQQRTQGLYQIMNSQQQRSGEIDDNEIFLASPPNVIPHNTPWQEYASSQI